MRGDIDSWFAESYAESRERFLTAARAAGLEIETHEHPLSKGGDLAMDVARVGDPQAKKLLVFTSGVHGPELMCGSGCQTGFIEEGILTENPKDIAVLLIHGVNPWGAAHLRRNNEDNVDLCRNFVDHDEALPVNNDYRDFHPILTQPIDQLMGAVDRLQREQGLGSVMTALMGGQYEYPGGFGFGGQAPTWSHLKLLETLQHHAKHAKRVCIVDFHSGIGPYGYGAAVCLQSGDSLARARRWFGEWIHAPRVEPDAGPEGMRDVKGHCSDGYERALTDRELTAIVLEYGTYPTDAGLKLLLEEHAAFISAGGVDGRLKERMLRYHLPEDHEWRRAIWDRALQVSRQAVAGLTVESPDR